MSTIIEEDGDVAKRRDRHDIIVEILKTAINGKVKTHIMYKARLSYAQVNEYLPQLIEKGFLENHSIKRRRDMRRLFQTTSKGLKLIENFESMRNLWSALPNSSDE